MVLEKIPADYIASLPHKKVRRVASYITDVVTGEEKPSLLIIPPLNTNIDISSLPRFDPRVHIGKVAAPATKPIPDKFKQAFNWMEQKRDDQPVSVNKAITPVGNQHACGCCWAFAVSNAVSDTFVVNQQTTENPQCSVTYALSCYPHCKEPGVSSSCYGQETGEFPYSYQCNGGAIAPLLLWISRNGIGTNSCEDFSWCDGNQGCVNGTTDTTKLNDAIPKCGCKQNPSTLYYIDTPISKGIESENPTPKEIQDHIDLVKHWIYNYGSIVTGFFVYANLMGGRFTSSDKNPEGIYLEDVDYNTFQLFENQENPFEGGHAVCIVGWGIGAVSNSLIADRNLRNTSSDTTMVPYWVTRNSWSTAWGQKGLFKMAMYPFNKTAQFDKYVMINTPSGRGAAGGQVLFEPGQIKTTGLSSLFSPITALMNQKSSSSSSEGMFSFLEMSGKSTSQIVLRSILMTIVLLCALLLFVRLYSYILS